MRGRFVLNLNDIKKKVRLLREHYPDYTAFELLKHFRVVTHFLDDSLLDCSDKDCLPDGCYFKLNDVKFVLINPNVVYEDRNRVYAHELGHVLFHPDVNTLLVEKLDPVLSDKLEIEADNFAAEFLLDDDVFTKHGTSNKYDIARLEKVPVRYVDIKFNNLNK